jgi:uncharacterized protein YbjT (DUF2867 family)
MSGRQRALIAGASGLVGGELLKRLIASSAYDRVIVLTRRDLGMRVRHPKLRQVVADFARLEGVAEDLVADHVFCTLGTTLRKAGSQAKFVEVDLEYPLRLARVTRAAGARQFSIVSALGASRTSPFFYSRVKGEVEAELRTMGWPGLTILRPSVIAGQREESRPAERLGQQLLRFAPATWRSVSAADIAGAMLATALGEPKGVTIVESRDIRRRAR